MTHATNCIIIHGCPSTAEQKMDSATRTYNKHWIPWLTQRLNANGVATAAPLMPDPWAPDYQRYTAVFDKHLVTDQTILVGHSCGCAFLVRWLGDTKTVIRKLILVAPWKIPKPGDTIKKLFYTYPIDESIKNRIDDIVMFTADNEAPEGKQSLQIFHHAIGGSVIQLSGHGHYIREHMGTDAFPQLLDVILGGTS